MDHVNNIKQQNMHNLFKRYYLQHIIYSNGLNLYLPNCEIHITSNCIRCAFFYHHFCKYFVHWCIRGSSKFYKAQNSLCPDVGRASTVIRALFGERKKSFQVSCFSNMDGDSVHRSYRLLSKKTIRIVAHC